MRLCFDIVFDNDTFSRDRTVNTINIRHILGKVVQYFLCVFIFIFNFMYCTQLH